MTQVKKYCKIIELFINSKNEQEALRYENKLFIMSGIPLLIIGAVLNAVILLIFLPGETAPVWINSGIFLAFACVLYLLLRFVRSPRLISNLIFFLAVAIVAFIITGYYRIVGPAVWTGACIIVIFATTKSNRLLISVLAVCLFAVGIFMWIKDYPYEMGSLYYIAQFIAFALLFVVSAVVQAINFERLKKTKYYLNETELISKISSDLITVNAENLDEKVNAMLERSGAYLGVDRSAIFLLTKDQKKMIYAYEWCAEGQVARIGIYESFDTDSREEWVDQIQNNTVWIIPDVDKLDEKEAPGKKRLQGMNVKAMISMPFEVRGRTRGILFYESQTRTVDWQEEHLKILDVITNLLRDTFLKVETEEEISNMAYTDALTGLPNRSYFNMKLDQAITKAKEIRARIAIVFIDLDSFKSINDTTGHEGGDKILALVGRRLAESLPESGVAARFGGDEFILMIPDVRDMEDVRKSVADTMAAFGKPFVLKDMDYLIMMSAGVAVYPEDGTEPRRLIKNADRAMYAAKELGKNQAVFSSSLNKEDIERKVRLTNQLYRTSLLKELVLDYQPLVDLETKEIVGFESLLRWQHPELGLIQPDEFIPLAEQTGLINGIGEWVLREACRQNKAWQDAGFKPVRMSVNVSAKQFLSSDLIGTIKKALSDAGLEPRHLELEITESAAINKMCYISQMLEKIKALGVTISIDDFGTEYSSLSRITRMPVDRIKMPIQFVSGIAVNEKDETVAKIIINLASSLGLKVIAEGVETKTQFDFLKKRICDEVQGFYLYKPMPADEIEKILRNTQA